MKAEEIVAGIKGFISIMEKRCIDGRGKYVMANDDYIQVDEGKGLNGTNVTVRCSACACGVVCIDNEIQARRSADYHLIDGAGHPILLRPMKAEKFFADEITRARGLVEALTQSAQ